MCRSGRAGARAPRRGGGVRETLRETAGRASPCSGDQSGASKRPQQSHDTTQAQDVGGGREALGASASGRRRACTASLPRRLRKSSAEEAMVADDGGRRLKEAGRSKGSRRPPYVGRYGFQPLRERAGCGSGRGHEAGRGGRRPPYVVRYGIRSLRERAGCGWYLVADEVTRPGAAEDGLLTSSATGFGRCGFDRCAVGRSSAGSGAQ